MQNVNGEYVKMIRQIVFDRKAALVTIFTTWAGNITHLRCWKKKKKKKTFCDGSEWKKNQIILKDIDIYIKSHFCLQRPWLPFLNNDVGF